MYIRRVNGFLTMSQAAEQLGTRWRMNALIREGRLNATRMGQIFDIGERDLKAVENCRPPTAKPAQNSRTRNGKKSAR